MTIERYVRAAPKVELHVHLEGAIEPDTILALARRNGVALPVHTADELRAWFRFSDFATFNEVYSAVSGCLRHVEDYELAVYELAEWLAGQNVRYAEVTFTPSTKLRRFGIPFGVYFDGLTRGRRRALAELGVRINWVFDIARNSLREGPRWPEYTLAVAIDGMADGVVALGLGGDEAAMPPDLFRPWFERARAAGLRSAPHAGEFAGPASVRGALELLGADRIGHGVRAIEDEGLTADLAARRVTLEVCPTANGRLGVYTSLVGHPLPRPLAAGAPVTIASDCPTLFDTTLEGEIALLATPFNLGIAAIDDVLLAGVRAAFLPPEEKAAMEAFFRAELTALKGAIPSAHA